MAPYFKFVLRAEYEAQSWSWSLEISTAQMITVPGHVDVVPSGRCPMAHQFDSVCGNEPTPQIMIQLIGCRIPPLAANASRHLERLRLSVH